MRFAFVLLILTAASSVSAQEPPPKIGPYVIDLHMTIPRFPSDDTNLAASRGMTVGELPGVGIGVQLDSVPGSLPDVGTLQLTGGAAGAATFTATGAVHRAATTDATGAVSFAGVPAASYQLTGVPAVASSDGLTVTPLDLTAGAPAQPVTVSLASKVAVTGSVTGAPASTRIIILDVPIEDRVVGVGFVADCVYEVTDIDENAMEAVPSVGGRWRSDYIAGIGRKGDKFVIIFDLKRLMAHEGMPGGQQAQLDASVAA